MNQASSKELEEAHRHLNALLDSYFVKDREGLLDAMIRALRFQRSVGATSPELEEAFRSDGKDKQGQPLP